ncbi:MAG: diguanylate cyclase, partial [Planctomycetia bacterium]|nr:diguanylate cyclase [Planctomycetia bacterium]
YRPLLPKGLKDNEGIYLGCNSAFEDFTGMSRDNMVGHSVYDLYPQEQADLFFNKDRELLDNPGVQTYESDLSSITGQQSVVSFHKSTYLNKDGSVAGLVGTIFDITHQKQLEKDLDYRASHDHLTGMHNRAYALQLLEACLDEISNTKQPVSILMVDFDYFKELNDSYGHKAGDLALISFAADMKRLCSKNNTIARFGGEEFLIILPDTGNILASQTAEKLRSHVEASHFDIAIDINWPLTVSIGVATTDVFVNADTLIMQADEALYNAKAAGRNCVIEHVDGK